MSIVSTIEKGVRKVVEVLYKKVEEYKNWKWSDEVILVEPQDNNVVTFEILPTNRFWLYMNQTQLCNYAKAMGAKARVFGNKVKFIWPDTERYEFTAEFVRETWHEM